jgi:hypothetical protein
MNSAMQIIPTHATFCFLKPLLCILMKREMQRNVKKTGSHPVFNNLNVLQLTTLNVRMKISKPELCNRCDMNMHRAIGGSLSPGPIYIG